VDVLGAPVVVLDGADCAAVGRQLAEALRLAYGVRGQQPPRDLERFANALSRAGRSAKFRSDAQASPGRGTGEFRNGLPLSRSEEPVTLTIREAAQLAGGISEGYMRRCCRRGDVQASRGRRGWAVDIASLWAWASERRKETDRKAA
jgi:hypothetical protein